MSAANAFYFVVGALAAVALLFVVYPWVAGQPRRQLLSALPRWVPIGGAVAVAGAVALYLMLGSPQLTASDAVAAGAPAPAGERGATVPSGAASARRTAPPRPGRRSRSCGPRPAPGRCRSSSMTRNPCCPIASSPRRAW